MLFFFTPVLSKLLPILPILPIFWESYTIKISVVEQLPNTGTPGHFVARNRYILKPSMNGNSQKPSTNGKSQKPSINGNSQKPSINGKSQKNKSCQRVPSLHGYLYYCFVLQYYINITYIRQYERLLLDSLICISQGLRQLVYHPLVQHCILLSCMHACIHSPREVYW